MIVFSLLFSKEVNENTFKISIFSTCWGRMKTRNLAKTGIILQNNFVYNLRIAIYAFFNVCKLLYIFYYFFTL